MLEPLLHHRRLTLSQAIPIGSLLWPRPYFPTRWERAQWVANVLPSWAIASGITAGWVWTGMGYPTPWQVLRDELPGLSPLERTSWQARLRSEAHHSVETIGKIRLLSSQSTAVEVLLRGHNIDAGAAQLLFLLGANSSLDQLLGQRRTSPTERHHAEVMLERAKLLRNRYPDITRYTS